MCISETGQAGDGRERMITRRASMVSLIELRWVSDSLPLESNELLDLVYRHSRCSFIVGVI